MTLLAVQAAQVAPQRWRNGGGRTRELLTWPAGPDWMLRVSLADIEVDGPFSAFAGVQRWFAVIDGAGVVLSFPGGERHLDATSEPIVFDGGDAPACRLVDGPTHDLNLMLRGGLDGCLQRAVSGRAWHEAWPWRACFVAAPARWLGTDGQARDLEAGTLLADLPQGSCCLEAIEADTAMFWLGASALPR